MYSQIYQSLGTPTPLAAVFRQMSTKAFQSMLPRLAASSPHIQVEEIQKISLGVSEIDPIHDVLQAGYVKAESILTFLILNKSLLEHNRKF